MAILKFRVVYNSYYTSGENKGSRRHYHFISEILEAQGVMHASRIANTHAKELSKNLDMTVRVAGIDEVIPK